MSNFGKLLEIPLIKENYKGELKRKWKNYFVFFSPAGADDVNGNDDDNDNIFIIKDTQLYVSGVTLTARGNQKLLKCLSKRFERSLYWNKYKAKSENKNKFNLNSY